VKKLICSLLILSLALLVLTVSYAQDTDLDTLRAADVNADGVINILDLTLIATHFGETPLGDKSPNPDVNGDGIVNILDLTLVASHFGKTVRQPVAFISADPAIDSQLAMNDTITLTFDNTPNEVTVNTGVAIVDGEIVTITGPFTPGPLELTIIWSDGTQTLTYTVKPSVAFVSIDPGIDTELTVNDTITLTFDNTPNEVTVNTGVAIVDGEIVTITGPFTPGPLELTIIWSDGTQTLTYTVKPSVAFVSIDPGIDTELTVNDTITLTFDNTPNEVTVSVGDATIDGKIVTITGPFTPGPLNLTITWDDGSLTLTYAVAKPDTDAPDITSGTVSNGDKDVDSKAINSDSKIEIEFSEEVTGNITLQTTTGDNVGWLGKIEGNKGILELVKGKELGNEITYVIVGKVKDTAGNETGINITFTTASKTPGIPIEVTDATFDTVVLASEVPIVVEFYTDW
jgi:phage baseplate assembly protein gpV